MLQDGDWAATGEREGEGGIQAETQGSILGSGEWWDPEMGLGRKSRVRGDTEANLG